MLYFLLQNTVKVEFIEVKLYVGILLNNKFTKFNIFAASNSVCCVSFLNSTILFPSKSPQFMEYIFIKIPFSIHKIPRTGRDGPGQNGSQNSNYSILPLKILHRFSAFYLSGQNEKLTNKNLHCRAKAESINNIHLLPFLLVR